MSRVEVDHRKHFETIRINDSLHGFEITVRLVGQTGHYPGETFDGWHNVPPAIQRETEDHGDQMDRRRQQPCRCHDKGKAFPCSLGAYQHKYGKHEGIGLGGAGSRHRLIVDELDELAELDEVGHSGWDGWNEGRCRMKRSTPIFQVPQCMLLTAISEHMT